MKGRSMNPACVSLSILAVAGLLAAPAASAERAAARSARVAATPERVLLVGIGDSLTHGTMDATNNTVHTQNAYLQKVADKLAEVVTLRFRQPLYDFEEKRTNPFTRPTNLGVDGADSFTVEGLSYYKRSGTTESLPSTGLICDRALLTRRADDYDKVMYPINLLAGAPVSQMDAAAWTVNGAGPSTDKALVVLWIGNNDSSTAALGQGGSNPEVQAIPLEQVASKLKPTLRLLLRFAERSGQVSFEPYTQAMIERNLTDLADFSAQFDHLVTRLATETTASPADVHVLALDLPYYSAVGFLLDSEDLEFYLRKYDPAYTVPLSFQRVAEPGQPITNPLKGDRVNLLTFGFMLSLMATGASVTEVNAVLETNGQQRDGLVLSEAEQAFIRTRIDAFNAVIHASAAAHGPNVHVVDIGTRLNQALTGESPVVIGGRTFSRKWQRGGAFSLDGVHPAYTGQALIANMLLHEINGLFGYGAPLYDLAQVAAADPYIDQDGDGFARGVDYTAQGFTELLLLLRDPDDADPGLQAVIPADIWDRINAVLLKGALANPVIAAEARRLGIR
jgi:lysophospholipase L1-like esterase